MNCAAVDTSASGMTSSGPPLPTPRVPTFSSSPTTPPPSWAVIAPWAGRCQSGSSTSSSSFEISPTWAQRPTRDCAPPQAVACWRCWFISASTPWNAPLLPDIDAVRAIRINPRKGDEILILAETDCLLIAADKLVMINACRVGEASVVVDVPQSGVVRGADDVNIQAFLLVNRHLPGRTVLNEHGVTHRARPGPSMPDGRQRHGRISIGKGECDSGAIALVLRSILVMPVQ